MNQQNLLILFYLNKSKINQKGTCPIYCRITFLKKRKQFATGEFINPSDWNAKQQKAISYSIASQQLNMQLQIIVTNITKEYLKLQLSETEFTAEDIFRHYIGEPIHQERNLIDYFNEFLVKKKKLIGIDLKQATWKKYYYACEQTKSFIQWQYKKHDVPFNKLNQQFLDDFEFYLKTELNQRQVTVNKTIQRLRKPIKTAVSEGYINKDPFSLYKPGKVSKSVIFLTVNELERLEKYQFIQPRLNLVRDLFIFCCYTGLAYHEMSNLTRPNLIEGFDGKTWIQMKREKTGRDISIPLLPKAERIIAKYNSESEYVLPKLSNQKINSYLKEIADILGIEKKVTHHTARKTFASTVLLYNDVSIELVSELLGHSSISITESYYGKVVQKRLSECIAELGKKLNQ